MIYIHSKITYLKLLRQKKEKRTWLYHDFIIENLYFSPWARVHKTKSAEPSAYPFYYQGRRNFAVDFVSSNKYFHLTKALNLHHLLPQSSLQRRRDANLVMYIFSIPYTPVICSYLGRLYNWLNFLKVFTLKKIIYMCFIVLVLVGGILRYTYKGQKTTSNLSDSILSFCHVFFFFWMLNSSYQSWWQAHLLTETFCWP